MSSISNRKYYIDILRILAIAAVVLMHVGGHMSEVNSADVTSLHWQICNIFDTGTRWAVPIFVMISGSLFLNPQKKITTKDIYKKYILRLVIAYLFWSLLYTLIFSTFRYYEPFSVQGIKNTIAGTLVGGMYHLWFIPMLIGLYILTPVLKELISNISREKLRYLILVMFLFQVCLPMLRLIPLFEDTLGDNIDSFNSGLSLNGYLLYFIVGYYINTANFNKIQKKVIYILGIVSFFAIIGLTGFISYSQNKEYLDLRNNYSLPVFLMSIALFLFIKERYQEKQFSDRKKKTILLLSRYSFGIYLTHEIILSNLKNLVFFNSTILSIIIVFTIVTVSSFLVTVCIDKIKYVRDYII